MKNSIVSTALESLETPVPGLTGGEPAKTPTISDTAVAAKLADKVEERPKDVAEKIDKISKDKIVANGPLGMIFTRALNIAYAKRNPATGDYAGLTPATESQAQDFYYATQQVAAQKRNFEARGDDPTEPKVKEIPEDFHSFGGGTKLQAPITTEELINFVNSDDFAEFTGDNFDNMTQVTIVKDVPASTSGVHVPDWENVKLIMLGEDAGKGTVVLESIEIVLHTRTIQE